MVINFPLWITLLVLLVAAALLFSERLRPDLIALLVLVVLGLTGTVSPAESFAGFSGSAVMTIVAISIISEGLRQTGVTQSLGNFMHRLGSNRSSANGVAGQNENRFMAAIMLTAAGLSLFMNNIAAVGVLLPAVTSLARRTRISPGRLMMPLAYGVTLGGMATLLTTSNIIVSGALHDAGYAPFGLLDFLPVGIPIVTVGVLYMLLIGKRLLPFRTAEKNQAAASSELPRLYELEKNLCQVTVLDSSPLVGLSIRGGNWGQLASLNIIGLTRSGQFRLFPLQDEVIRPRDILLAECDRSSGLLSDPDLQASLGLQVAAANLEQASLTDLLNTLAEIVMAPRSSLTGQTLRQIDFRAQTGLNVLAIWREARPLRTGLGEVPLRAGDALLVQGESARIRRLRQGIDWIVMTEDPDAALAPHKSRLALWITLLTLGIASLGLLPVSLVAMAGAVMLLLTRCLSMGDVYTAVEWKAIFLIAGMWPLSTAIRSSGLAGNAIHTLLSLAGSLPPLFLAAILILVAMAITQLMGGQVASLVVAPLAIAAGTAIGADVRSLSMAVALGCSLAFPTPFGHPVNIMVMNPGGYTFRDYLRVGLPLSLLAALTILVGLKLFWGL